MQSQTDTHASSLSLQVLSTAFDEAVRVLARTVRNPAFDPNGVARARFWIKNGLRDAFGSTSILTFEHALRQLTGEHGASAILGADFEKLGKYGSTQAQECHSATYKPEESALVVVGAISDAELLAAAARYFGTWRSIAAPRPLPRKPLTLLRPRGVRVDMVGAGDDEQAQVYLLQRAPKFAEQGDIEINLIAELVAGMFESSANRAFRHAQGVTYGVDARRLYFPDFSLLVLQGAFENEEAASAVEHLLEDLKRLRQKPISASELAAAKARVRANYIEQISTNSGAAELVGEMFVHRMPDLLPRFEQELARIDAQRIQHAAQRHLDPENATLVVYGAYWLLMRPFERIGKVRVYRLEMPED